MKLYTNATIKITERNSFVNDKGETIEYGSIYLKDSDEGVIKVSTGKSDFSKNEGQEGLVVLNARETNGSIKLSVIDFKEGGQIDY